MLVTFCQTLNTEVKREFSPTTKSQSSFIILPPSTNLTQTGKVRKCLPRPRLEKEKELILVNLSSATPVIVSVPSTDLTRTKVRESLPGPTVGKEVLILANLSSATPVINRIGTLDRPNTDKGQRKFT